MNVKTVLFIVLSFLKLYAIKINLIQTKDMINSEYEELTEKKTINDFFILAELEINKENEYFCDFNIDNNGNLNKGITTSETKKGKYYFQLYVNFDNDAPKYNLKIAKYTAGDNIIFILTENEKEQAIEFLANNLRKKNLNKYNDEKKIIDDTKKYILNLINGVEEKGKKWALFKIKTKDWAEFEKIIYSNNIECTNFEYKDKSIIPPKDGYDVYFGPFSDNEKITSLEILKSNIEEVKNLSEYFKNCNEINYIDLTKLKSKEAIYLNQIFFMCENLKTIRFPTNPKIKAKTVNNMFYQCNIIQSVNLEDIDLEEITDAKYMVNRSNITKLKFPKMTINKKFLNFNKKFNKCDGIIHNSNITELDTTNLIFNEESESLFGDKQKCNIDILIIPEDIKNLSEERINEIFKYEGCNVKFNEIKIGENKIKLDKDDNPVKFIKDPELYLENRDTYKEEYKKYKKEHNIKDKNEEIPLKKIELPKTSGCSCKENSCKECSCKK